ncbi:mitochondrial protein from FMP27-domain-containing protein, partial [Tuber brumale]
LLGVVVLAYLSTFVLFAVLRIITGISIQRIGYFSLKRMSYEPKNGIKLEVRKLGLLLHRPTFAQPTWISIAISDSQFSVDLRKTQEEESDSDEVEKRGKGRGRKDTLKGEEGRGIRRNTRAWEGISKLRESLKKVHKLVKWLQMVDIVFTNTNLSIADVGSAQVGSMTMILDTRRKTAERNRMFDHTTDLKEDQNPIEWMFTARSVLFFPEKKREPIEILDHCNFNIYGLLENGLDVFRDAAMALKVGKITIPLDEILGCLVKLRAIRAPAVKKSRRSGSRLRLGTVMEEMSLPGSTTERMAETVMQSKEFLESLLRGLKEVQFAIGYLLITRSVRSIQPSGKPLKVLVGMKELAMDVHRLDQKSPAHRMYFSPQDIAHQALLAAISISVSVDDGVRKDKFFYIPMVTMTSKTTLPSKTIQLVEKSESNRNTNILFANVVVTSPSIDLEPRHLPILLALVQSKPGKPASGSRERTHLISKLLPKASINFSVHEPVIRILLPSNDPERRAAGDMDMLISSLSSISAVADSSHESEGQNDYSLSCSFRITSHHLYYQAYSGEKHDLLQTDAFDIRFQVNASPEVEVTAHAYLETFSLRLVRPEIVQGIKQTVGQFHRNVKSDKLDKPETSDDPNFLRRIPLWIDQFKMEGVDFSVEVAGVDEEISEFTRGVALQLDSWTIEYRARKSESRTRPPPRRRAASRTLSIDDTRGSKLPPAGSKNPTDCRKLSFHIRGLEGYMVDSPDSWEQEPFLNIPHFDIAFATSGDLEGPVLHISSHSKLLSLNYSLYRHYTIIVAAKVLMEAFGGTSTGDEAGHSQMKPVDTLRPGVMGDMDLVESPISDFREYVSVDFKVQHVRIKSSMPDDPPMMLEVFGLDTGRQRWGFPFLKAKSVRLYAESPKVRNCWARMISIRQFRADLREGRRNSSDQFQEEKSIDLFADAVRLAIPHQLVLYKVTDNVVNTAKACQQMHHRFKTGTNEYILEKKAESAKKVPRLSLSTKALLLELEDDPFETQLGLIYRLGLSEQKKRLAREAAFDAKVKKMGENERRKSSETTRTGLKPENPPQTSTSRFRGRTKTWGGSSHHVRAESPETRSKSVHRGPKNMRYDPESAAGPSDDASVSIEEAWERLQEHNSAAWIKRMRWAHEYHSNRMKESREQFWGHDDVPYDREDTENILGLPMRPALMAAYFNDVEVIVDKPSFPLEQLPKFMHRVGKGLPEDTEFALLVPVSVKVDFGEGRILLRDYPLPLIHVPRMRPSQANRSPAWSLRADFVLAEELRGPESMRHVRVNIVPPASGPGSSGGGFAVDVRRTVSPVKSYSEITVDISTSFATRITWCTSYQPAIQDMMMVFETFTKPHFDPSDRTGFWDKIRLVLHSQISVKWKGDGDVHLTLKGSRDPYQITGIGAGFVLCWRGDVNWEVGRDEDPRKFMVVDSEEFLLAIPDFARNAKDEFDSATPAENKSVLSSSSCESAALFKKVIMKLSGRVRWLVGLMFEQEISEAQLGACEGKTRSFEFKSHYEVTLKTPAHAKAPPGRVYDAFRGFRSHHLHLSLAILSPIDRDWSPANTKPSTSYNTIHLTPRFFTHFFSWWGLFSGVMSLPIRQGPLWPGPEKSNKKFGRHLATIKYKLCISPLFISHMYKHNDKGESGKDVVVATGLKAKLDSLMVDIHQRREETLPNQQSTAMRINQAELDFHSADIRAVSALIAGATPDELMKQAAEGPPLGLTETIRCSGDVSQFTVPDGDYSWIDMDDFIELDWVLPHNKTPKTKIMPLAFTPRFTYFRQTDHTDPKGCVLNPCSPFGDEPTHDCLMSENNDPREIQCGLVQARLEKVNEQMNRNKEALDNLAQYTKFNPEDLELKAQSSELIEQSSILFNKLDFLQTMLRRMSSKLDGGDRPGMSRDPSHERHGSDADEELIGVDSSPFDYVSDFDNRFIVHNMQAKWNNSLRNIILKYIHQVGQRRGFVYYMSRRAVKFILDIVQEQKQSGRDNTSATSEYTTSSPTSTPNGDTDSMTLESRIQQLLDDDNKYVVADEKPNDPEENGASTRTYARDDLTGDVADDYLPLNSYHIRLIAPQIQMQSEKNKGAAVLVVAQGMQLKVVSIMDRDRVGDEVSGLVQRRFALNLENTQFFVSHRQDFAPQSMSLHSANRYGAPGGSSWPPWVPLESMFDFQNFPVGFSRVVERTSATLRYDKYNSLRLKYSDQVSGGEKTLSAKGGPLDVERRIDHVWVDFPKVEASCDSSQYFAMYIIVLDLLLYAEPLEKLRNEKLEKIMLASDFSDLTGAPEMVERLQSRIHQLEEIKTYFQINSQNLDIEGWRGRVAVDEDLASCEEELFFMMKAITTAQRKHEDRTSQASGILRWYLTASEIVWHMLRDKADPLMEIRLKNAGYKRMDNADGSNFNTVEVEMMEGFNLLPDAVYPEMIAPFFDQSRTVADVRQTKILRVYWHMLEAIAGIPVMDHFEVNLFPLKIQLEREIGDRIFEYIFPGVGTQAFENGGFSPFLVHSMKPIPDGSDTDESDEDRDSHHMDDSSSTKSDVSPVEIRLRPTLSLTADHRPGSSSSTSKPRSNSFKASNAGFRGTFMPSLTPTHKSSVESLSVKSRKSTEGPAPSIMGLEKNKKLQIFNRSSNHSGRNEKRSDELSQMMSRASNFMTLAYIKIPSVVLCLSYKGRGDNNFEDVHEFVFRMPMLEYRNKTWSNLDLAIRLKKDIIRALISHTGAILQNKLTHHRPNKTQPNLLRMMANNGSLGTNPSFVTTDSDHPGFDTLSEYASSTHASMPISRPSTGYHLKPPSVMRPVTSPSSASSSTNMSFPPSPLDRAEEEAGERSHGIFHNTLGRHLSNLGVVARAQNGIADESEESIKKKSRLLLGKKVFGSL